MVEPDQDPQPVIGKKPGEDRQAPVVEIGGGCDHIDRRRGDRAHGAILIVPGGTGECRRKELMTGAIQRPQRSTLHGLLDEADQAFAARQLLQRREASPEGRLQHEEINAEEGRGESTS